MLSEARKQVLQLIADGHPLTVRQQEVTDEYGDKVMRSVHYFRDMQPPQWVSGKLILSMVEEGQLEIGNKSGSTHSTGQRFKLSPPMRQRFHKKQPQGIIEEHGFLVEKPQPSPEPVSQPDTAVVVDIHQPVPGSQDPVPEAYAPVTLEDVYEYEAMYPHGQCQGMTGAGKQCKNQALEGGDHCRIHMPDEE